MRNNKKIWTREEINQMIMLNDHAVERAIVRLYKAQTQDETLQSRSKHRNGRGFNAAHAKSGTLIAQWILGLDGKNRQRYEPKSLLHPRCSKLLGPRINCFNVIAKARKIALIHSSQLVEIANNR